MSRAIVLSLLLLALAQGDRGAPPTAQRPDVYGVTGDLLTPSGPANVLLFVTSDCPISNRYAPEIQHLCADYRKKDVSCTLVYEDTAIDPAAVRAHGETFGYRDIPAVIDEGHAIAARVHATVTPQAVVIGAGGRVHYRGRIDNRYERLGTPRRVVMVHDLRDALDDVLAGRAVGRPATEAVGCFIPFGAVPFTTYAFSPGGMSIFASAPKRAGALSSRSLRGGGGGEGALDDRPLLRERTSDADERALDAFHAAIAKAVVKQVSESDTVKRLQEEQRQIRAGLTPPSECGAAPPTLIRQPGR